MEDAWRRRDLSAGFDEAAEVCQRTRPVCPPQLFDDLIGLAGLSPGNRVVEIGCGTGQATVPLAERGMAVTAVEPGPNLAAIARRRLAGFPTTDVLTASFEDWQPRGALAILATQSGTRALGPARGADFLSRVSGRLDSLGSPELTATFVGYLTVGRRLDFRPENRNSEGTGR